MGCSNITWEPSGQWCAHDSKWHVLTIACMVYINQWRPVEPTRCTDGIACLQMNCAWRHLPAAVGQPGSLKMHFLFSGTPQVTWFALNLQISPVNFGSMLVSTFNALTPFTIACSCTCPFCTCWLPAVACGSCCRGMPLSCEHLFLLGRMSYPSVVTAVLTHA